MQIIEGTTQFHIEEKTAIAIGKFDGIHRGHKEIFKCLKQAKEQGLKTAIFTFDPSPTVFFSGGNVKELTTRSEKRILFEQMEIDYLVEYPFGKETAAIDPEQYVREFLLERMNGALVVAGADVSFGKGGKGNRELLEKLAVTYGFTCKIIDKLKYENREISSTYVREEVTAGNMEKVRELLGSPFFVSGVVENGKKLGRRLGMPTTNLYPEGDKLLPPRGVYFSKVWLAGKYYYSVTNIGLRPTVDDGSRVSVETYLLDFHKEIYGEIIKVELLHSQRPERQFDSVEQLREAVLKNIKEAEAYFFIDR